MVYLSHRTHEDAAHFHIDRIMDPAPRSYFGFSFKQTAWSAIGDLRFESEIDSSQPAARVVNDTDAGLSYGGSGWFYSGGRPARIPDIANDVHATTNKWRLGELHLHRERNFVHLGAQ